MTILATIISITMLRWPPKNLSTNFFFNSVAANDTHCYVVQAQYHK